MSAELPRFVDTLSDHEWSLEDIDTRARSWVESVVTTVREQELQTIAIGAIMGLRAPTPKEQGEFALVQDIKLSAGLRILEARSDRLLLLEVKVLEKAQARLLIPAIDSLSDGYSTDVDERSAAAAVVAAATPDALALAVLRNRNPPVVPPIPSTPEVPTP